MAFVKIKVPRTRQPQDVCGIDWSNPITKHLTSAWTGGRSTGLSDAPAVFGAKAINPIGVGGAGNGTSDFTNLPLNALSSRDPDNVFGTKIVLMTLGAGGSSRCIVGGSTPSTVWQCDGGTVGIRQPGSYTHYTSPTIMTAGETCMIALAVDGTAIGSAVRCYKNGMLVDSSTTGTIALTGFVGIPTLGSAGAQGRYFDGVIYLHLSFDTPLSTKEVKSLYDNPWQVFEPEEISVWVPDVVASTTDSLTPKSIVISALTSSAPTIGQIHVLPEKAINLSPVSTTSIGISQVHQLVGGTINLGATTVANPAIGQAHALIPQSVNLGSLGVSSTAVAQVHALVRNNLTISSVVTTPAIFSQAHTLTAQATNLSAITVGHPALTSASNVNNLSGKSIALEAVQITKPSIEQIHILTGLGVSLNNLTTTKPEIGQIHVLPAQPITLSESVVSKPDLTSLANTDNLSTRDIVLGAFTASNPIVGQVHILVGRPLVTGLVQALTPMIGQVHGLTSRSIVLGYWGVSNPTLSGSPVPPPGVTTHVEFIFSEVVDDKVMVVLQDDVIQTNIIWR